MHAGLVTERPDRILDNGVCSSYNFCTLVDLHHTEVKVNC